MNTFKRKALFIAIVASLGLAGCAGQVMSPEQIAANAKDRNAVAACGTGSGPWGKVTTVYVDMNKLGDNQAVSVDGECKVVATSNRAVAAPVPVKP